MRTIHTGKGYDLNISGEPSDTLETVRPPDRLALLPERLPFVKPRLKVQPGDRVRIGSPLIEDKRNPDIQFLSPGAGTVDAIRFGPRRVVREIVVDLDAEETHEAFERFSAADIATADRDRLVAAIVRGGLWPLIRQLPFRDYARPEPAPPAIYVVLGSTEPFAPHPSVYLKGQQARFAFGLTVLGRLAENRVVVCAHRDDAAVRNQLDGRIDVLYSGPYPAHDPGVLVYRSKTSQQENRCWYIDGQDVLLLARLLETGTYPTERIVTRGGASAPAALHLLTRTGAPLAAIAGRVADGGDVRRIAGGVLTGYAQAADSYLGFFETALNLVPEGNRPGELLGLFRPGYRKPSFSRAFTSALRRASLEYDCNVHGGDRACIACGYCTLVCPVDILPQFTYKAALAGEVEEALEHGLLDCVECGLCAYVCPSKIDLTQALKTAKADFYKEQGN